MGLLNKKDEDADQELLQEETTEEGAEEQPETPAEPETPAAVIEARDSAKVCVLINRAIQAATDLAGSIVPTQDNLEQIKTEANVHAARAQGIWQAVDNGALAAGAQAAESISLFADEQQLGELAAAIIVDARDQLQDLLGLVEQSSPDAPEAK